MKFVEFKSRGGDALLVAGSMAEITGKRLEN
jgi:hypothetical protein